MNTELILNELNLAIKNKSTISEVSKKIGVNRSVLYRMFERKDMSLGRFAEICSAIGVEPVDIVAAAYQKTVIDGTLLDLEFQLNSDKLKIEHLEKKLADCQNKANPKK